MDLAGGTLDIWPLGLFHHAASTVNFAVDLGIEVRITRRPRTYRVRQGERLVEGRDPAELSSHPDGALVGVVADFLELPPVEVELRSASPRGGGLGASSAMTCALLSAADAIAGRPARSPSALAALARDLEARLMRLPTGTQDHYAAILGGALEILHEPGGEVARPLDVDLEALGASLVVAYSGQSHFSAGSNWQMVRRRLEGDPELAGLFAGIAEVAGEMAPALVRGRLEEVGRLMSREWSFRRHLAEEISTPAVESLLRVGTALGAWGGKACGAGGGGCVALLCPPERRPVIAARLAEVGGQVLALAPTARGLESL